GRDDMRVTLSLAGRTSVPAGQTVPVRVGGFGGAEGLARSMRKERVTLLIDATHPFAARISLNAAEAARLAQIAVIALRRPAWSKVVGDDWIEVRTIAEAVASLGNAPKRAFVTFGRQELAPLEDHRQHSYLIRSID